MAKIATAQILTDLHAEILSDSGVTALIGSRLRYGKARQNEAKPYVTYQILTKIPTLTHDGDASQCRLPIQFDVWADTHYQATQVADALESKLVGIKTSRGSTGIQFGNLDRAFTAFDDETEFCRFSGDFNFWFGIAS
jgi:hypothetical protein